MDSPITLTLSGRFYDPYCPTCGAVLEPEGYCPECEPPEGIGAERLGRKIQEALPDLIHTATEGALSQDGGDELVLFDGYGFRVQLSDGSSFDITIVQRAAPTA